MIMPCSQTVCVPQLLRNLLTFPPADTVDDTRLFDATVFDECADLSDDIALLRSDLVEEIRTIEGLCQFYAVTDSKSVNNIAHDLLVRSSS